MSGTAPTDRAVTRGEKRRAQEQEEETRIEAQEERMIPRARRVWIPRRKSEHTGEHTGGIPCPGSLIRESDLYIHQLDRNQKPTGLRYKCGGDSCFFAKRFANRFPRLIQFTLLGGNEYQSIYRAEDDPSIVYFGAPVSLRKQRTQKREYKISHEGPPQRKPPADRVATRSEGPPMEAKAAPDGKAARELARLRP